MRVVAMLAWYDEPPALLSDAVSSVSCIADTLVAFDGAYRLRPDAKPTSPVQQYQAIEAAANKAGLQLAFGNRRDLWEGQVEKRDAMLQRALELEADWVLPLDADWWLEGDREKVRAELEQTELDCLSVPFHTPHNGEDLDQKAAHPWHKGLAGVTVGMDAVMRALPGMRVERHHWVYSGLKDGRRVGLWGGTHLYPAAPHGPMQAPLSIEHRCFQRDQERIDANREFCRARDEQVAATGVEA